MKINAADILKKKKEPILVIDLGDDVLEFNHFLYAQEKYVLLDKTYTRENKKLYKLQESLEKQVGENPTEELEEKLDDINEKLRFVLFSQLAPMCGLTKEELEEKLLEFTEGDRYTAIALCRDIYEAYVIAVKEYDEDEKKGIKNLVTKS